MSTSTDYKTILLAVLSGVPDQFEEADLIYWANSPELIRQRVSKLFHQGKSSNILELIGDAAIFFGKPICAKDVVYSDDVFKFNHLCVKPKDVSIVDILSQCEKLFPVRYHYLGEFGDNLVDDLIDDNRPSEDYIFSTRGTAEAENFADNADCVNPRITLAERLLLELAYFRQFGLHLDCQRVTCCFGTIHKSTNDRPVVCWRDNALQIYWKSDRRNDILMGCSPYWTRDICVPN